MFITCIIGQSSSVSVKHKPAFLPGLDLAAHLDQEAPAGLGSDGQVEAGTGTVSCCLDVAMQVEIILPQGQVTCQRAGLERDAGGFCRIKILWEYIMTFIKNTITYISLCQ